MQTECFFEPGTCNAADRPLRRTLVLQIFFHQPRLQRRMFFHIPIQLSFAACLQ